MVKPRSALERLKESAIYALWILFLVLVVLPWSMVIFVCMLQFAESTLLH